MAGSLFSFMLISILVIVTPGPDTLMTIRNVVLGGRRAGIATAIGVTVGQMLWALVTSLGIVAVLLASEIVFNVVKLLGAGYLVWLGAQSLVHAFATMRDPAPGRLTVSGQPLGCVRAFRNGLIGNLGNPKMAVFFASILPQFAPAGDRAFAALAMLSVAFAGMTFAWLTLYAVAVAALDSRLRNARASRIIEGVAGTFLVAAGVGLATEHR
jgi:threonine/homoserine/homoserine lactone efflux protein